MFNIPLEYLMFGGIGFCLAWLTALMVMPAVHNRAVRLARERYETLPLSMQEIRAEKDTIRAGFAAATRELEVRIEKLKEKTAAHATDLAKKNQLIDRLKQEIDTITAALRDSETREQAARDELREAKRDFATKDVTLGTAEGEITVLQRDLAARDTTLRAVERDAGTMRSELASKDSALALAEKQMVAIKAALRDSEAREHAARDELRETKRRFAERDVSFGAVEGEVAALQRELAAREVASQAAERDAATMRSELAGKDTALTLAEQEIAAIKAEIAAIAPLLLQAEKEAGAARRVDMVPLVPSARPAAPVQSTRIPVSPPTSQPIPQPAAPRPRVLESAPHPRAYEQAPHPRIQEPGPYQRMQEQAPRPWVQEPAPRAPLDVIPAPTRLIPSTIPQAQPPHGNGFRPIMTEIADVARRVDPRPEGANQRLRAAFAPLAKT